MRMDSFRGWMTASLLSLVGLILSLYLTLYKFGFFGILPCQVGSCDLVQNSAWGTFAGLPVAAWGVLGYASALTLSLLALHDEKREVLWGRLLVGVTGGGFLVSMALTYVEAFVLRAWCQWCVISAILMTLLFAVSFAARPSSRGADSLL